MSDEGVLNPLLYRRLLRRFGEVRVRNRGQARVASVRRDLLTDEPQVVVKQWGEQYLVRCPFCRDRDFQLSVSYLYGQRDDSGRPLTNLAFCHASRCLARYENRLALAQMLGADDGILEEARIHPAQTAPPQERVLTLPKGLVRLDKLPKGHPARKYLAGQGLDPDRVGRCYRVSYCAESEDALARGRIIIPVKARGQLRGWQALSVHPPDAEGRGGGLPRYLSAHGMESGKLLYNLDGARQYQTGVFVRDPTHVWAFGPMAVCPATECVTEDQRRTFLAVFRRRTAVVLLSPREYASPGVRDLVRELGRSMPGRFAEVRLPEGTAPGLLGRAFLREQVVKEAKKQGVKVGYAQWD